MASNQPDAQHNDSLDAIESKLKHLEKTLMSRIGSNDRSNAAHQESQEYNEVYQQELNSTDEKQRLEAVPQIKESAAGIKLSPKYQPDPVHKAAKKKRRARRLPGEADGDARQPEVRFEEDAGALAQTDEEEEDLHDDEMQEGTSLKKDLGQVLQEQYAKLSEELKLL